jgi:hypothetical protein
MVGETPESPEEDRPEHRESSQENVAGSPSAVVPRKGLLPYVVLAVVTLLVTWFAFASITGLPVGLGKSPVSPPGTPETGVVLSVNNPFDTARNATTDQVAPANFTVPAKTLLRFTFINYDTGLNPVTPLEASVNGTLANCIYLNSTPTSLGPCVHSVPTGSVSHTFSFVNGTYEGFNVPIPSALGSPEGGAGASVTFFAYFNVTGTFYWHCRSPCDPFSMATDGFMLGTMTVVPP